MDTKISYIEEVRREVSRILLVFEDARALFLKDFNNEESTTAVSFAFNTRAEPLIIAEEMALQALGLTNGLKDPTLPEERLRNAITQQVSQLKKGLTEHPYRHNSTSVMSNFIDECKATARSRYVEIFESFATDPLQKFQASVLPILTRHVYNSVQAGDIADPEVTRLIKEIEYSLHL